MTRTVPLLVHTLTVCGLCAHAPSLYLYHQSARNLGGKIARSSFGSSSFAFLFVFLSSCVVRLAEATEFIHPFHQRPRAFSRMAQYCTSAFPAHPSLAHMHTHTSPSILIVVLQDEAHQGDLVWGSKLGPHMQHLIPTSSILMGGLFRRTAGNQKNKSEPQLVEFSPSSILSVNNVNFLFSIPCLRKRTTFLVIIFGVLNLFPPSAQNSGFCIHSSPSPLFTLISFFSFSRHVFLPDLAIIERYCLIRHVKNRRFHFLTCSWEGLPGFGCCHVVSVAETELTALKSCLQVPRFQERRGDSMSETFIEVLLDMIPVFSVQCRCRMRWGEACR